MDGLSSIQSRTTLLLIIALSGVVSFVLLVKLFAIDRELKPYTILHYEFAWSAEHAKRMFDAWGEPGRSAARKSLVYDLPFILAYPFLVSALTLLAARAAPGKYALLGVWLGGAPFVAAILDVIEDIALWRALDQFQQPPEHLLQLAAIAAGVKFLLLALSGLYALAVWFFRVLG